MYTANIGDTLPNGATVLAINHEALVVLADCGPDSAMRYATWRWNADQGLRSTWSGHYFNNIERASADYVQRAQLS